MRGPVSHRDGVTMRSVHNRLSGRSPRYEDHSARDARPGQGELEIKTEAAERQQSPNDLADAIAEGTGRHQIVTPMQGFTPASARWCPSSCQAPAPKERKSGFFKSAKKAALSHGGTALGAVAELRSPSRGSPGTAARLRRPSRRWRSRRRQLPLLTSRVTLLVRLARFCSSVRLSAIARARPSCS